jgi:ferredoxin-NADP reductase
MEKHIVKVLKAAYLTHNVRQFTLEKPAGYTFVSGQATDVSINKPGLEDELRPFTFTCVNGDDHLEFTIKIYTDHDGVTSKLAAIDEGDELIVHEVFGSITAGRAYLLPAEPALHLLYPSFASLSCRMNWQATYCFLPTKRRRILY